jgi:hypothetical protein
METIMIKSNDTSKLGRAPQVRELRDDELPTVSGGAESVPLEQVSFFRLAPAPFSIDIGTSENLRAAFVEGWPTK